jgi:hypothetical protein
MKDTKAFEDNFQTSFCVQIVFILRHVKETSLRHQMAKRKNSKACLP